MHDWETLRDTVLAPIDGSPKKIWRAMKGYEVFLHDGCEIVHAVEFRVDCNTLRVVTAGSGEWSYDLWSNISYQIYKVIIQRNWEDE